MTMVETATGNNDMVETATGNNDNGRDSYRKQ